MNRTSTRAKVPKTARGRQTRDKLLQAAEVEFGEKGFHEASVSGITYQAGVALGTFYTYFESKEEIYKALVGYMSGRVRSWIGERVRGAPDRLTAERRGLQAYLEFVREHPGLYRIISEAEFIANDEFMAHYSGFAEAYRNNLAAATQRDEIREGDLEVWSWAFMGMMVFLGMRFAEWDHETDPVKVAKAAGDLIADGISRK
ncbi:MAG: TetR/AcrR family transcriptional regulator [Xanthomonadales bacterium]|nr:TetR/AcrR family transcriptional regulator [Xanthomonadales bacterium]